MSCETINLKNRFDLILLFETLEHVQNEEKSIKNIANITNASGEIIISASIEKWFGAFIKDIGRKIILRRSNHSFKELYYILIGKLNKVKRVIGSHPGYDFENTISLFEKYGFKVINKKSYPLNIKYLDYGVIFVLKKKK